MTSANDNRKPALPALTDEERADAYRWADTVLRVHQTLEILAESLTMENIEAMEKVLAARLILELRAENERLRYERDEFKRAFAERTESGSASSGAEGGE